MPKPAQHPLRSLLVAQFFGAFNDNAWKLMLILLGIRTVLAGDAGADPELAAEQKTIFAFVVFTLPLLLFSIPAGAVANRVSKRTVIVAAKWVELLLLVAGTALLYWHPGEEMLLLVTLGLLGTQSAFFSPAKYGILPELLPHDRLSEGNGLLEMWTFLAIVCGTACAGPLLDWTTGLESTIGANGPPVWIAGAILTVFSLSGLVAAYGVPHVPRARNNGGVLATLVESWGTIRSQRVLYLTVVGMTYYWLVAAIFSQEIIVYCKAVLDVDDTRASWAWAVFGVGVVIGSIFAGKLSAGKVELGLIPLGAALLGAILLLFGITHPGYEWTLAFMLTLGISSALLNVPLNTLLQWKAPTEQRGGVIALANVFVVGGMLVGAGLALLLAQAGVDVKGRLLFTGLITLGGTLWAFRVLPLAFLRLLLVLLTHTLYKLRVSGREHVPQKGGALLVPNHVSFADGLFLIASVDRHVRFIVHEHYFSHPFLKPFMKALGAIPISDSGGPRVVLRALREAGDYLDKGEIVCIFAEGQITRTGTLQPFRRGLERIVKGRSAPIIPVQLDRVWGSIFSYAGGRFLIKRPKRIPYPVSVSFGKPLPAGTSVADVRRAVHELSEDAWRLRQQDRVPVHHSFIRQARKRPFSLVFADATRPHLSRLKALASSITLARALRRHWQGQKNVGMLLPPTVPAALANVAAAFAGRTSVNLNYTVGRDTLRSAIEQSELKTVLTSHAFLEKFPVELPDNVTKIWMEDVATSLRPLGKVYAFLLAVFAPKRWIERACGAKKKVQVDDLLTIIFSSGSTGEPKGVMLSHANVDSNVQGLTQVMQLGPEDRLLGILPLFHSFGYMGLWFASNRGLGTVFHHNPLDAAAVGELVHRYNVTVMIATPTFLQLYLRRCTPAQFGSLRLVLAGAEKLSPRLATAFEEHFGIRPLEGYGTTECAPVITVSTFDYRAPGFFQPGSRRGSVGQPLPGVAIRIVDPDSREAVPVGEPGLILVRGANVMQGYLRNKELTDEVFRDGWYVTGDIGALDEDGFLRITDRLSRFSKIGGEMVPHGRVEQALQEAAGEDEQVFAVTAVPDEKKGERLAVLHTIDPNHLPDIVDQLTVHGLPNLFIPRLDQFLSVEKLPLLGTGKLDLKEVKRVARERTQMRKPR